MKKSLIFAVILTVLVSVLCLPVHANGNEWIYDEAKVISVETEEYIKVLNEETFSAYKSKPQLGIVIVNDLPDGISMEEYKLQLFNQHGVGTKEENCGMLFVFAINARQYGFEIGDGFEKVLFSEKI